jgi:hypothetical protein
MSWLDVKLLATIGASAAAGVVATAVLLAPNAETITYREVVVPGITMAVEVHPEGSNLHQADLIRWWEGETPLRFSGPGARGMSRGVWALGNEGMGRKSIRFRLKEPPRRLGFQRGSNGVLLLGPELRERRLSSELTLEVPPTEKK